MDFPRNYEIVAVISMRLFWRASLCWIWCYFIGLYLIAMLRIWKVFFDIDWRESHCVVTGIRNSKFTTEESSGSFHYATFTVKVLHDGLWMTGFACGTPDPHSYVLGFKALNTTLPYTFGTCAFPDICGNEVIQPTWYCSDCKLCDEYLTGEQVVCKWAVIDTSDSVRSADDWPESAELDRPRKGSSYIQVVLGTEVYYSKAEFIVLQIFAGLLVLGLPGFCISKKIIARCRR